MSEENKEIRITFDAFNEIVKLDSLKESRYQRNKHPEKQIELLARLMREKGVRHPIHVHKEYGEICFGHGRMAAARLNGWTEYPIVYQSFENDHEYYQCVQSDNAIALWAELDLPAINADIQNFGPDFDVDLLGIKEFVIDLPPDKDIDEKELDENIPTEKECPSCGYKW